MEYNIEHGHGNFGGDMMLNPEQMGWIEGGGEDRSLMAKYLWPRTGSNVLIPYTQIKPERYSSNQLANIQAAMDAYAELTCIRYYILTNFVKNYQNSKLTK